MIQLLATYTFAKSVRITREQTLSPCDVVNQSFLSQTNSSGRHFYCFKSYYISNFGLLPNCQCGHFTMCLSRVESFTFFCRAAGVQSRICSNSPVTTCFTAMSKDWNPVPLNFSFLLQSLSRFCLRIDSALISNPFFIF